MDPKKKSSPFKPSSKKEWTEAAKQELGGTQAVEKLIHSVDGVRILSYYDALDLPASPSFHVAPSENQFAEPRSWCNMPRILVKEAVQANKQALHALNHGAEGILFELTDNHQVDRLLNNIELPYCHVSFLADNGQEKFLREFNAWVEKKFNLTDVTGAVFWKRLPENIPSLISHFEKWGKFHPLGLLSVESKPVAEELATLLADAVTQIDALANVHQALASVTFSVSIGGDFFLEIARIKVLRALWHQVTHAYAPGADFPLYLHATVNPIGNPLYEPHGDLIKATPGALCAIMGGCDALTIDAINPEDQTLVRASRNVSTILRTESHFGKVVDPTAGSYFLESLIDELSQKAWRKFQELMAS